MNELVLASEADVVSVEAVPVVPARITSVEVAAEIEEQARASMVRLAQNLTELLTILGRAFFGEIWVVRGFADYDEWFAHTFGDLSLGQADLERLALAYIAVAEQQAMPAAPIVAKAFGVPRSTFRRAIQKLKEPTRALEIAERASRPISPQVAARRAEVRRRDMAAAAQGERIGQERMAASIRELPSTITHDRQFLAYTDPEYAEQVTHNRDLVLVSLHEPADPRDRHPDAMPLAVGGWGGPVARLYPDAAEQVAEVVTDDDASHLADAEHLIAEWVRDGKAVAAEARAARSVIADAWPWEHDALYPADLAELAADHARAVSDLLWCLRMLGFRVPDFDPEHLDRLDGFDEETHPLWAKRARTVFAWWGQLPPAVLAEELGLDVATVMRMHDVVAALPPARHWPALGAVHDADRLPEGHPKREPGGHP